MKFDWLLFDLDNTIFDFSTASRQALDRTLRPLVHSHLAEIKELYHLINRQVWNDYEEDKLNIKDLPLKRAEEFLTQSGIKNISSENFNDTYLDHLASTSIFLPTVEETLQSLKDQGAQMAIITNGLSVVQRKRWAQTNLSSFFQDIYIAEEIGKPKPHSYYFDVVHGKIGRPNRERVLVIGDNVVSDIHGGRDYGYKTCWLISPNERLAPVPADFQINKMSELLAIVDSM